MIRPLAWLLLLAGVAWCDPITEEPVNHAGTRFRVVRVTPAKLQVVWKDSNGVPYRTFDRVQTAFAKQEKAVRFLMNAGIFEPGGIPSGLHRNGVGIDAEGRIVFAITDRRQEVNLWDFAGLFLKLGCNNALFLDGDISQSVTNPTKTVHSNQFGAIFAIAE